MSSPNATVPRLGAPGEILAEVATLAMTEAAAAYRAMRTPSAVVAPHVYLHRNGRLERVLLASFDVPGRTEWALRALLPVIITAGAPEIVAAVHTGHTSAPVRREATFLHVFSTEHDERWQAGVYRRPGQPPRLGSWRAGADQALSERTLSAIREAMRSTSANVSEEAS